MIAIRNCKFFKDHQLISDQTVLVDAGKIKAFITGEIPAGYRVIDAMDNI